MGFGLFGKLPQKRDFMSVNLPHAVLNPFETWLQSAVAASRQEIGRNWENYFLVAPIWRFWLGKDVLGTACTGCLMPSVDQVGRYFPLAILYWAEPGETLTPPLINPIDEWYRRIEERLLAVLSDQPVDVGSLMYGLMPPDYTQAPPPVAQPQSFAPQASTYEPAAFEPLPELAPPALEPEGAQVEAVVEPEAAPVHEPEAVPETLAAADDEPQPTEEPEPIEDPSFGPDDWDSAAEQALKVAAASLVDSEPASSGIEIESWNPEPMPADKLAALKDISAASFAPTVAGAGGSFWDLPVDHPPPVTEPAVAQALATAPASTGSTSLWDMPDTEPVKAASAAAAAPPSISEPIGVLSAGAALGNAPAAPPAARAAEPVAAPRTEPEPVRAAPPPPAAAAPPPPPRFEPQITTSDFKGGLVAVLENVHTLGDALPQLMALDFASSAQGRGYWWCGPSSSGGPRMFSKAGLPDPYFFTQMLLWPGK